MEFDKKILSFLEPQLLEEIASKSTIQVFKKGTEILKQEQYIKVLPIVIEGLVKVYSKFNEKELLLYYIEPAQSCVLSFYAALKNTPSKIFAEIEDDSKILLVPVSFLPNWLKTYPKLNELFYNQFNLRYSELLDTISHLLLDKLDKRLYNHLVKKTTLTNNTTIKISHNQLANELGTAREVVSRVIKKLEIDGLVAQKSGHITILNS